MAVRHQSALKAARQSTKRRDHNRSQLSNMRTTVKKFREAIEKKGTQNLEVLSGLFSDTQRILMKAASKGLIKKGNASRHIARLSKRMQKATAGNSAPSKSA